MKHVVECQSRYLILYSCENLTEVLLSIFGTLVAEEVDADELFMAIARLYFRSTRATMQNNFVK